MLPVAMAAIFTAAVSGCTSAVLASGPGASPATAGTATSAAATATPQATQPAPTATSAKSASPSTAAGWDKRACRDFATFYQDLRTDTPRDLAVLLPAAGRVLSDVIHASSQGSRRLFDDANDLVADVGSLSWWSDGSVDSRPVRRMAATCRALG
jgi:hypothetical protein